MSRGEKEKEIDVGRTTTLSPSKENPEQVLPNVTVQYHKENGDEGATIAEENGQLFPNTGTVSGSKEEISLESWEKAMQDQAKEV